MIVDYVKFYGKCFDFDFFMNNMGRVNLESGVIYHMDILVTYGGDVSEDYVYNNSIKVKSFCYVVSTNLNLSELLVSLFGKIDNTLEFHDGYCLVRENGFVCHKIFYIKIYV
jgi:hypothetical protein